MVLSISLRGAVVRESPVEMQTDLNCEGQLS